MDKYLVPVKVSSEASKPVRRHRWGRSRIEVDGRLDPKYRHYSSQLFVQSYAEVGAFCHAYNVDGDPCLSHLCLFAASVEEISDNPALLRGIGISALDFDQKGIYLASVTKAGCLTVYDFEALYCQIGKSPRCMSDDESKHLLHIPLNQQLDVVRWNFANQDEVICASAKNSEVLIFDVSYISSEPVDILRTRNTVTVHGSHAYKGLSDVAFIPNDPSRIIASGTNGVISIWDRRKNVFPCLELTSNTYTTLNRIQVNAENQIIFGAGKQGIVYMWDIRGGRSSSTFQSHNEVRNPPLASLKLASMMEKIGSLNAQTEIISKEILSVDLNPSCPYQLAFHLEDGWSGVLDTYNFHVTHVHCPPPACLNEAGVAADLSHFRKPTWVPTYSIYAVGSASERGIHLLDFYPYPSSPSHVDYDEEVQMLTGVNNQTIQNRFLPLSKSVTACAAHPLNGTLVAGTKDMSLLMISQRHESF